MSRSLACKQDELFFLSSVLWAGEVLALSLYSSPSLSLLLACLLARGLGVVTPRPERQPHKARSFTSDRPLTPLPKPSLSLSLAAGPSSRSRYARNNMQTSHYPVAVMKCLCGLEVRDQVQHLDSPETYQESVYHWASRIAWGRRVHFLIVGCCFCGQRLAPWYVVLTPQYTTLLCIWRCSDQDSTSPPRCKELQKHIEDGASKDCISNLEHPGFPAISRPRCAPKPLGPEPPKGRAGFARCMAVSWDMLTSGAYVASVLRVPR